jgi:hypothetical protein
LRKSAPQGFAQLIGEDGEIGKDALHFSLDSRSMSVGARREGPRAILLAVG